MNALRFITKVENNRLLITDLQEFDGQTVELIIVPLRDEERDLWAEAGARLLDRAYGPDEPEYDVLDRHRNSGKQCNGSER